MKDWTVESRYKMAIEYFKRAESTMNRNFVVSESLTKAIKSNLIAISMLLKKLDVRFYDNRVFKLIFLDGKEDSG
jgi:hypothetical protein